MLFSLYFVSLPVVRTCVHRFVLLIETHIRTSYNRETNGRPARGSCIISVALLAHAFGKRLLHTTAA